MMGRRNTRFQAPWKPFRDDPSLNTHQGTTTGAVSFFNPTHARFDQAPILRPRYESDLVDENALPANVHYEWTSRDNRKARHALAVRPTDLDNRRFSIPPATSSLQRVLKALWRMLTFFPIHNISWWVAIVFTYGSIIWIISSFFNFMPLVQPQTEFPGESSYAGGITACLGSLVFFAGSVLLWLELINENREGCLGWAVERVYDENTESSNFVIKSDGDCSHEHHDNSQRRSWNFVPSLQDLKEHYFYELSFWACLIQLCSSCIFLWAGFEALPGVNDAIPTRLTYGIFWTPKLVACSGFVTAGVLLTLETQRSWWKPALRTLGWHASAWKTVGSLGFLLFSCFGFSGAEWAQIQSAVHCLWGSWAFLIASVLLWYEVLAQYPVEVLKMDRDDAADSETEAEEQTERPKD